LGTVNSDKLSAQDQATHKSKMMRHINFFRRQLHDVMIELGMDERESTYHLNRIGMDREYGKPSEKFAKFKGGPSKDRFRDVVNRDRNSTSPDDTANLMKPPKKEYSRYRNWYNRLMGGFQS
jgi:hypothetical protein